MGLVKDELSFGQRGFMPFSTLHLAPQNRLQTQRCVTFQHSPKLRNAKLSTPPYTQRLTLCRTPRCVQHLAQTISPNATVKSLPICRSRAAKPRPASTIRKPAQCDAYQPLDLTQPHKELCCLNRDDTQRPQAGDQTLGKSSRTILKVAFTANWINHSPSFEKSASS